MRERWLPVPGFDGLYEVSDHGSVRATERTVWQSNSRWGKGFWTTKHAQILSVSFDSAGHHRVSLSKNSNPKMFFVHRLVLAAFIGPCPDGFVGCHNDDDKTNNHISNLRWDSPRENSLDQARNGVNPNAIKTACKRGHALDERNTYIQRGKSPGDRPMRSCRACRRAAARKHSESLRNIA